MKPIADRPTVRVAWIEGPGRIGTHGGYEERPVYWMKGGLAVTPSLADQAGWWTVTHVRSGWAVTRDIYHRDNALEVAKRFLRLGNWERSRLSIWADKPFLRKCLELQKQLKKEGKIS